MVTKEKKMSKKIERHLDLPKPRLASRGGKPAQYVYFLRVGDKEDRLFKIGTTNNPRRRMLEHERAYGKLVEVLWLSPPLSSRFTTLRVEENMIDKWKKDKPTWEYKRNDRFIIPNDVDTVTIKIRKNYYVSIPQ